eukprot:88007-Amphidinium_carterae.1
MLVSPWGGGVTVHGAALGAAWEGWETIGIAGHVALVPRGPLDGADRSRSLHLESEDLPPPLPNPK